MAKWEFLSWKTLSIVLSIILIPFFIGVIVNYTTWLSTKRDGGDYIKIGWMDNRGYTPGK